MNVFSLHLLSHLVFGEGQTHCLFAGFLPAAPHSENNANFRSLQMVNCSLISKLWHL